VAGCPRARPASRRATRGRGGRCRKGSAALTCIGARCVSSGGGLSVLLTMSAPGGTLARETPTIPSSRAHPAKAGAQATGPRLLRDAGLQTPRRTLDRRAGAAARGLCVSACSPCPTSLGKGGRYGIRRHFHRHPAS